jgi:choline-sulfatase
LIVCGHDIASRRIPEPVSLLDLGPTLCSLAGVDPIYDVTDGRDLGDLLCGRREPGPGLAIMENYGEGVWRGWRMIRRGDYKLNVVPGFEPELFNLAEDPGEWHDLAGDRAHRAIREALTAVAMDGWDPDRCNEARWQSEERRLAILRAGQHVDWQTPSPSVPHPLRSGPSARIDNVSVD